jgi:hypothetical protein
MHTIQSSHRSVPEEDDVVVSRLLQRLATNPAELDVAYQNGWSIDGPTRTAAARCLIAAFVSIEPLERLWVPNARSGARTSLGHLRNSTLRGPT